jgi:prophage antirepressor-like protein
MKNVDVEFDSTKLTLYTSQDFEWLISTKDVAFGYGVSMENIRSQKANHSDELIEGKHFISNFTIFDGKQNRSTTVWTKRGVIRLGFFIKSERAKKFRDWAEDLVINKLSQTPETAHQTVQVQNETLDLDFYTQQSEKIFKLVQLINSQNTKTLYFADNLYKNLNIKSPLELLKIDLSNYYFIPTELGNFINTTAVETNKILEAKGLQVRENGVWNLTEKGRNFAIEVQNGSFLQIKWKIKAIFE